MQRVGRVSSLQDDGRDQPAIIGTVARELRREVGSEIADRWTTAALASPSYDALLRLALEWVTVE